MFSAHVCDCQLKISGLSKAQKPQLSLNSSLQMPDQYGHLHQQLLLPDRGIIFPGRHKQYFSWNKDLLIQTQDPVSGCVVTLQHSRPNLWQDQGKSFHGYWKTLNAADNFDTEYSSPRVLWAEVTLQRLFKEQLSPCSSIKDTILTSL